MMRFNVELVVKKHERGQHDAVVVRHVRIGSMTSYFSKPLNSLSRCLPCSLFLVPPLFPFLFPHHLTLISFMSI